MQRAEAQPQAPAFVQLFIAVDDVAASVEKAVGLGAKVLIPPTTLPEGDQMAVLHDPSSWLPSGDAAHRAATPAEIAAIVAMLETGLKKGAVSMGAGLPYTEERA